MAVILSRTNLISYWNQDQQLQCHSTRVSFALPRLHFMKMKSQPFRSSSFSSPGIEFYGERVFLQHNKESKERYFFRSFVSAQMTLANGRTQQWWQKGLHPEMREVTSARDLADSLKNAGDKLVVVDFFSPGCGGCKALHPKICQLAERNPEIQFLHVNYEKHKSMCYTLGVHVLPFFRFYRGAEGRLCSFSCTNATIKKFRDALSKHSPDRCSLGPTKGLNEEELLALGFKNTPLSVEAAHVHSAKEGQLEDTSPSPSFNPLPLPVMNLQISSKESLIRREDWSLLGDDGVSISSLSLTPHCTSLPPCC